MNFKDFLKKAFGKEKDERVHAIVMLGVYAIFILIVILVIRTGNTTDVENKNNKQETNIKEDINEETKDKKKNIESDINYSYSYKVEFDDEVETYLGKKLDDKEKFSYIKNDKTVEYAIYKDNYLILEDGIYHITDKLDGYFKYCDMEKVLTLIEEETPNVENSYVYDISSSKIASIFEDELTDFDNEKNNKIEMTIEDNNLKTVTMDLSNYISNILKKNHKLIITMEFANVGTTEDFDIKMN